jgi:hypothetical protein
VTHNHRPRSVARDARAEQTPAEEIPALLAALYDRVDTSESIVTHRRVRRGPDRIIAVPDIRPHRTTGPGLLAQLGVTAGTWSRVAPVEVRRWESDHAPGTGCREKCGHGRWVVDRVEHRIVPPRVAAGAAVPGGSPGWDADGALSPLTAASKPESAEPIAETWHVAHEIEQDLAELVADLRAEGRDGSLVDIALDDERAGARIVRRLRGLVARARIAADYDAPIVPLRDICCPECGGEMRVRQDASSAVWCAGSWLVEGPAPRGEPWPVRAACGASWPRGAWVALLADVDLSNPPAPARNDHRPAHTRPRDEPDKAEPLPAVLAGLAPDPTTERTAP